MYFIIYSLLIANQDEIEVINSYRMRQACSLIDFDCQIENDDFSAIGSEL
jgi:hypothetical protein